MSVEKMIKNLEAQDKKNIAEYQRLRDVRTAYARVLRSRLKRRVQVTRLVIWLLYALKDAGVTDAPLQHLDAEAGYRALLRRSK